MTREERQRLARLPRLVDFAVWIDPMTMRAIPVTVYAHGQEVVLVPYEIQALDAWTAEFGAIGG